MKTDFKALETQWCPGCGNFSILDTLVEVISDLEIERKNLLLIGGIGQAAKTNQFVGANGFSGLHGRAIPAAIGVKIANPNLKVIINSGDGDSYGEGGNHLIHNLRRNPDITHFVHDNQIYGLTTGQASPTSDPQEKDSRFGTYNKATPLRPLSLALASGATFIARTFSGDKEHMEAIMKAAIAHDGYSLVDILQPCVTFNKLNTFKWYKDRVYKLDEKHDTNDKIAATKLSLEWGDQIPIGILYQNDTPTYHQRHPLLSKGLNPSTEKTTKEQIHNRLLEFV